MLHFHLGKSAQWPSLLLFCGQTAHCWKLLYLPQIQHKLTLQITKEMEQCTHEHRHSQTERSSEILHSEFMEFKQCPPPQMIISEHRSLSWRHRMGEKKKQTSLKFYCTTNCVHSCAIFCRLHGCHTVIVRLTVWQTWL